MPSKTRKMSIIIIVKPLLKRPIDAHVELLNKFLEINRINVFITNLEGNSGAKTTTNRNQLDVLC